MRFPRTLKGWVKLFWLSLRLCPFCHSSLSRDWPLYDRGGLWCLRCGGVPLPEGVLNALRWNRRAHIEDGAE
jgi:hypothetical protein